MKHFYAKLTAYVLIATLAVSCKREQLLDTKEPQPIVKTKPVEIASEFDRLEMAYNEDGLVKQTALSDPRGLLERAQFHYEGGKLATVSGNGVLFTYTYQNNRLTSIGVYVQPGVMTSIYEFTYQNDILAERIKRVKLNPSGQFETYSKTIYQFSTGNLVKTETTFFSAGGAPSSKEVVTYTYDDKENTVSDFEQEPFLPVTLMKNNPVKIVYADAQGENTKTITHSYSYNQFGQPVTRKTIISAIAFGGTATDYTISYGK
ncbi:MAG: hypothetical protein EOO10_12960 [Chitinophagaceae bacterium]|nr:MAG: hypothetical protein EOO10_12960 [Chitinophagaceae bacterium]